MTTERNETSSDSDLKQPLHCIMEQQKAEREAMALQQQELTKMLEMVQTRSEAKTELNAPTVEETPSVSMKDLIIQSNGINDEIRNCMMELQKSEREAMTPREFFTKMLEMAQLRLKATNEINAVNYEATPSVSMKDLIMQSTGTNVEISEMMFYQDFIKLANPIEKAASSKPGLTLDTLSGYAENDKTYTQYEKLKVLEGINIIKIPGHKSFTFDKMAFESKDQIYCDTKVIVEHYRYKPTNTEMAVKFLRIPFSFSNDESKFESFFKKIQREMNTCKEFPSSSNLVELYGFCIYGGYILICMEYMDMSLYDLYKQMHKKCGHFPHELLGIIAVSIVDALNDLKSKNIMHRDIKPQNILINRQGEIKLCDFGVSRILVDSHATTVTIGTALYWPPERFKMSGEDAKYDIRADVWSLGITLIELLKGKHPYGIDGENKDFPYALIQNAINNLNVEDTIPQDLPNNLKEFITNCLRSFEERLSYTELISSSLYKQYKKIARTVIVELIGQTMLHWAAQVNKWDVVQWLLEHGKVNAVTFQGKKISLKKLIDEQNEELKKLIDSEIIVKLVSNADVAIGSELITLGDEKNYYINRSFTYPTISMEIFKESQGESQHRNQDLLVINGIDKTSLGDLVRKKDTICSFQEYNPDTSGHIRFVILDDSQAAEQFKKLCQLQPNIHWLTSDSGRLVWNRSQGSLSNLHKHIEKKNTKHTEDEWLKHTNEHKVIIISDTAGMGKSTVLTNLAHKLKEQNSGLWIVRINLNEYTNELSKEKEKGDFKAHDINQTTNIAIQFLEKDILKLSTPLERALFKAYFKSKTSKLIIMFDGFDEISPDYRETVINLIQGLRNSTIKQIWVTTRPTEKNVLEEQLQHLSFTLESFSEKNQIDFLTKFWQQKLNITDQTQLKQFEVYAGALIRLLARSISDKDKEFTGIPLQTRMLAEAFGTDFETFYKSNQAELPKKMDLTDLYERFLKKKYDIQQEKSKLDISQPNVKTQSETGYSKFIGKHQNLALYTLFPEDKVDMLLCEKFYQELSKEFPKLAKLNENNKQLLFEDKKQELLSFINDIKISKINNGIIDQIIEHKPHFIHITFAEYLVGKFFVASIDNETIVEFVLQEILMQPAYQVTRAFLNGQLPESLPENTLARYGEQIERLWQSDKKNLYNKKGMTLLHLAAEEGTVNIIRFLLNSLKGHETILKSLLEATTTYYYKETALHLAAAGGYLDVVQWLVELGKSNVEATDKYGKTVLHYAARCNKLDVVQWLVAHGADVNATDIDGKTPLNLAEERKHTKITEYLLKKIVESVGQVSTESAAMADVITVSGSEDFADLLCETQED